MWEITSCAFRCVSHPSRFELLINTLHHGYGMAKSPGRRWHVTCIWREGIPCSQSRSLPRIPSVQRHVLCPAAAHRNRPSSTPYRRCARSPRSARNIPPNHLSHSQPFHKRPSLLRHWPLSSDLRTSTMRRPSSMPANTGEGASI